jgi:predicted Ser/Thr protein kinase
VVSPNGPYDYDQPHDNRLPDRRMRLWWGIPVSAVWAFAPLFTVGLATPLIIGHAAFRLRNPLIAWTATGYGAAFLSYAAVANALNDNDPATPVDPRLTTALVLWIFIGMIGGCVHAWILRPVVFLPCKPRSLATAIPHAPVPYPAHRIPPAQPVPPYGRHPRPVPQARPPVPAPARHPPPPSPAGVPAGPNLGRVGPYVLIRKLGEGGQGTVYLGHGPDGRPVAVKVLHHRIDGGKAAWRRFFHEVAYAQRVPGYCTARILDSGMAGDQAYIVSEYVHGPSLDRLVADQGRLNGDSVIRIAITTVAALKGIHSAGVVHRDFKPANVLMAADGPRVIDFGLARALDRATMTSGALKGTPAYMSPEQIHEAEVGPASDVFSWASTIFFSATGVHAFGGSNVPQVLYKIANHQPDLSGLPIGLREPISACFAKDPHNRPTAAALMMEISN